MIADFVQMLDKDSADFQNRAWGGVHRPVRGLYDDFAFDIIHVGALKRDDTVGVDRFVSEPSSFFDHPYDVVVTDPRCLPRSK